MVSNSSRFQSFFSDVPLQWVLYGLYATHLRRASRVTRDVTVMWQVLVLDGTHRKDGGGNAEEGKCWSGEGVCDGRAFPIFGIRHVTRVSLSVQDVRSDDEED